MKTQVPPSGYYQPLLCGGMAGMGLDSAPQSQVPNLSKHSNILVAIVRVVIDI